MAKNVVLLIHGMGQHRAHDDTIDDNNKDDPNISEDFKSAMKEGVSYVSNGKLKDYEVDKRCEIHEFNYSGLLDTIRKGLAESLADGSGEAQIVSLLKNKGNGIQIAKKLIELHKGLSDDEFFNTHWLDVLIYSTTFWGELIRGQLMQKINELDSPVENLHIVAHSLGTAVVHDTLWKLFEPTGDPNRTGIRVTMPESLICLANVSGMVNLLNGIGNPHNDIVAVKHGGAVKEFINVRHKYDPFTWFKTVKAREDNAINLTFDTIRQANTHDFKEYVLNPFVCEKILSMIDPATWRKMPDMPATFPAYSKNSLNSQVLALRKDIKKLIGLTKISDLDRGSLFKQLTSIKSIAKKIEAGSKGIKDWFEANS